MHTLRRGSPRAGETRAYLRERVQGARALLGSAAMWRQRNARASRTGVHAVHCTPAAKPLFTHLALSRSPPWLPAVQQNEILRENKFYSWTVTRKNVVGLVVMTIAFPMFYHTLIKDELNMRDERMKGIKGREYF